MDENLLARYLNGAASEAERREVEAWFEAKGEPLPLPYAGDANRLLDARERTLSLLQERIGKPGIVRRWWPRIAAAASLVLICSAGVYFALQPKPAASLVYVKNDVMPGHNQATLTLANGQKIILTKNMHGRLALQGHTTVNATGADIVYQSDRTEEAVSYNTLATGKREQSPSPLVLADGTKVWLNAESSLTFPTAFPGKERTVKLTGEAYFEVAHNAKQGFKVETGKETIEDIGTQFNIRAYKDEPSAGATLVEGAVKVSALGKSALPQPGEQVLLANNELHTAPANLKAVLAWKDGYFRFYDQPITTIMKELARWYDVDVVYQGAVSKKLFTAKISRFKNISAVLRMLEKTNYVQFKVEGRRVTVSSKS